ncbi:MAG: hypothetical protein AM326_03125 [Candidatus Thorarchaeota archaeon SMTZ-45]|nr:MAG: hypothetical protein AM326_03125 [Candidatus Thorarchaeota archaeon SMTZ-45]
MSDVWMLARCYEVWKLEWVKTYISFLQQNGYDQEEARCEMRMVMKTYAELPESLRTRLNATLEKWSRDDFVSFSGFLDALVVVKEWLAK